jgi:flagellar biosynthesis/type III secretory pathway chaperone
MTPTLAGSTATVVVRPAVSGETLLIRFLETVEEIVTGHHRLLAVLDRESRLIVEGGVDGLMPCLSEKEDVLSELARLERRRQDEFSVLRLQFDAVGPTGRMSQLIAAVPEPYRAGLRSCQTRLEELTTRIVYLNQVNGRVVRRILEQHRHLLGALTRLAFPPMAYAATGRLNESSFGRRTLGEG